MLRPHLLAASIALCLAAPLGCSVFTANKDFVHTDAALGKVIIYRNGVAYFERRAQFEGDKLTLTVPAARVDDFLKSLTVVDAKTGQALPVSFPTSEPGQEHVELQIKLPTKGQHDLRLSYVTESPAWKPTYRVVLGDNGKADLMAWAVVDNVSGEDWERVTIGVGSTSALSFRYDLRSVRMVERETLGMDSRVALAPPTGGSPYQVGGQQVRVVGNFRNDDIDRLAQVQQGQQRITTQTDTKADKDGSARGHRWQNAEPAPSRASGSAAGSFGNVTGAVGGLGSNAAFESLNRLADQLRNSSNRVRIEGFARGGDEDPRTASLSRANVIRDQLIANGLPPEQVEAVGTGVLNEREGVRMLVADAEQPRPSQPTRDTNTGPTADEPIGTALFVADRAMTIEDGRSAMVSLINSPCEAKQVYYFDPVSVRGSKRFAFKAVRLVNPSTYTLDGGPFTVYAAGQFLGEGLSEPIPPHSEAFIPFGLDREIVVDPNLSTREEIHKLITIERGIVTTESRSIRSTKLSLNNRGQHPAEVYVRHAVPDGYTLAARADRYRKLGGAYLFPVTVPPRGAVELTIEDWTPLMKTVDLRTDHGVKAIGLYLENAQRLEPDMRTKLADVIKMHREIHDVSERIDTLSSQLQVYRTRVDEIHVQLVTLRKVATAQTLSRHLAKKMEEISDQIQKLTVELTELQGQLMTKRIAIQDRLSELTLAKVEDKPPKDAK